MALTHPSTPELKRFTFFVTRQREDGRERFRLHMGYFPSQEEAEALLASVRDIYPAAWAGPAPSSVVPPRRVRADAAALQCPRPCLSHSSVRSEPRRWQLVAAAAPAPAPGECAPHRHPHVAPVAAEPVLDAMSNVRDVLAQLSDTTPKAIPAPACLRRRCRPCVPPPAAAAARPAAASAPAPALRRTCAATPPPVASAAGTAPKASSPVELQRAGGSRQRRLLRHHCRQRCTC